MQEGFLGTNAPLGADLVLLMELAIGVGLLFGARLARRRRYRAHAWCQSLLVLLNLVVICLFMVHSFQLQVAPRIPSKLGKSYFALATTHGALGAAVECAAFYILLAAGTNWLPERLRLRNYRLWMRTILGAWWLVVFLGLATYARWYLPQLFRH